MKSLLAFLLLPLSLLGKPPELIDAFLDFHCYECHDSATQKGDLNLADFDFSLTTPAQFAHWVAVYDRIDSGEMPPAKKDRPDEKEKAQFLAFLKKELLTTSSTQSRNGRAPLRRLSRAEFANSLKDLLDLPQLEVEDMLPPDSRAHGFQKSADALPFSHVVIQRYLDVADHALRQALATHLEPQKKTTIRSTLSGTQGTKDTLQTLFVQIKHGTAIPLNGKKIDTTMKITRGDFSKRQPGIVKDLPPEFDAVATFLGGEGNHNIVLRPFRVRQSGYYTLRVNGWSLFNDHGKLLPADRPGTVAFYSPTGRLLGRCDLPPNEPATAEVTVGSTKTNPSNTSPSQISSSNGTSPSANSSPTSITTFRPTASPSAGSRWKAPSTNPGPPPATATSSETSP